ncbi:hypothetical protein D9M68_900660 [compost metagenome]
MVGQTDQFPDIDLELLADDRQLIGKGDVHVTEAVLGKLAHLRSASIGDNALAFDEGFVQAYGGRRTFGGHAADYPVVFHQLPQHMTG